MFKWLMRKKSKLRAEEQLLASQLDYAKDHPEMAPSVEAPEEEFQNILDNLEDRGVTKRLEKELNKNNRKQ